MKNLFLLLPFLFLTGCGADNNDLSDLQQFVNTTLNKPGGKIESIPVFKPYEMFSYSATDLRSPFELPMVVDKNLVSDNGQDVQPDLNRSKEHLEQFALSSLSMVGTITQNGVLWALIRDGEGGVVRAKKGAHLGQNYGRIVAINEQRINIIEIVPNGLGGWIERPRTLAVDGLGGE